MPKLLIPENFEIELSDHLFDLFNAVARHDASNGKHYHKMAEFRRNPNWPAMTTLIEMGLVRKTRRREPLSYRSSAMFCCTDLGMQIAKMTMPDVAGLLQLEAIGVDQ